MEADMADKFEDDIDKHVEFFLRSQAMMWGECALNHMMYTMKTDEVIDWLKMQIELLEDHG